MDQVTNEKRITNERLDEIINIFRPYQGSKSTSAHLFVLLCELRKHRGKEELMRDAQKKPARAKMEASSSGSESNA
jgi:hypothetical protein